MIYAAFRKDLKAVWGDGWKGRDVVAFCYAVIHGTLVFSDVIVEG